MAITPVQKIKVLINLIAARYDYNTGMSSYMSDEMWKQTEKNIREVLTLVEKYPSISIQDTADDDLLEEMLNPLLENATNISKEVAIRGNLVSIVTRLDEEFTKSMQNADHQTLEYIERLRDEIDLYALIIRAEVYHSNRKDTTSVCYLKMLRLEHLYYKVFYSYYYSTIRLSCYLNKIPGKNIHSWGKVGKMQMKLFMNYAFIYIKTLQIE